MSKKKEAAKREISRWEWAAAGIGAVMVLGTIGYLLFRAVMIPDGPPRVEVAVDSIAESAVGYRVEFTARNTGLSTAGSVMIQAELRDDDGVLEGGTVTFDYLPSGAARRGGFIFQNDPRGHRLDIRARGYERP